MGRSLQAMPEVDRLRAAWTVVCGRALAAHGEIVGLDGGMVMVEVESPTWMEQMRSMQATIEGELGRIAGVPVSGIHFSLRARAR